MCVLRVSGPSFDPAPYLQNSRLKAYRTFRAGEPRWASKPDGARNTYSGFTVTVSDGEWTMRDQVEDAEKFLRIFERELIDLSSTPEIDDVRLDFPVELRDVFAQAEYFPPALVRAAGRAGVGLEITLYPCSEESDEERD